MSDAAWHPQGEIEIVAGTPPGGGQDRPARALIHVIESRRLIEVPVRLTNLPGRGGGNAWDHLRRDADNPHVLAISSPTLLTNELLGISDLRYSDLTPLANLYTEYIAFVVRSDSPIRTGGDLLELLAADSGSLTAALATALGNTNHMALAQVIRHAGGSITNLKLRVFDSAPHAVADVIEGRARLGVITAASAVDDLAAGRIRALAVSAPRRLCGPYAAVPAWAEWAVDCIMGTWRGIFGAHGLKPEHIVFWQGLLAAATAAPEWQDELARRHSTPLYLDGARLHDHLQREHEALRALLGALGLLR